MNAMNRFMSRDGKTPTLAELWTMLQRWEEEINYELHHLSADRFSAGEGEKLLSASQGSYETKADATLKFHTLQNRMGQSTASLLSKLHTVSDTALHQTVMHDSPGAFLSTLDEGLNLFVIGEDAVGLPSPSVFIGGIGFSVISPKDAVRRATILSPDLRHAAHLLCPSEGMPIVLGRAFLPFTEMISGWLVTHLQNKKLRQEKEFRQTVTLQSDGAGGFRGTFLLPEAAFPYPFAEAPALTVTVKAAGVPLMPYCESDTLTDAACGSISLYSPDELTNGEITLHITAEGEADTTPNEA